ncbi:MAG: serine protease, partial [Pseudomonadota bacterium]
AGGNSGGPLFDECGRVVGVNSSSTLSGTGEGEFFFAIANREVLSFLRSNDVSPRVSDLPCRSLAEIEAEEAERAEAQAEAEEERIAALEAEEEEKREKIELQIQQERENMMAVAAVLLLLAAGGGALSYQAWNSEGGKNRAYVFGGIGAVAALAAAIVWFQRPGPDDVDTRLLGDETVSPDGDEVDMSGPLAGGLTCTLDLERSRITGSPERDIDFDWTDEGCVNNRTQYGRAGAVWSRVFVPNSDRAVSVNSFDPGTGEYKVERYLIGLDDMEDARSKRQSYNPPSCGAIDAATRLGDMQGSVLASLPDTPNERLIYRCQRKSGS